MDLLLNLTFTILIHPFPILIYRFVIRRKPVKGKTALIITLIDAVAVYFVYVIINIVILRSAGITEGYAFSVNVTPVFIWGIVCYAMLHKGCKEQESETKETIITKQLYSLMAGTNDTREKQDLQICLESLEDKYSYATVDGWLDKFRDRFSKFTVYGHNAYTMVQYLASHQEYLGYVRDVLEKYDHAKGDFTDKHEKDCIKYLEAVWNLHGNEAELMEPVWDERLNPPETSTAEDGNSGK